MGKFSEIKASFGRFADRRQSGVRDVIILLHFCVQGRDPLIEYGQLRRYMGVQPMKFLVAF